MNIMLLIGTIFKITFLSRSAGAFSEFFDSRIRLAYRRRASPGKPYGLVRIRRQLEYIKYLLYLGIRLQYNIIYYNIRVSSVPSIIPELRWWYTNIYFCNGTTNIGL